MFKNIMTAIIFILLLYIGRIMILNPMNKKSLLLISIVLFVIIVAISYRSLINGLIISLLYLPLYGWALDHIFRGSILGFGSKEILLLMIFLVWFIKVKNEKKPIVIPSFYLFYIFFFIICTINLFRAPTLLNGLLDLRILVFYPLVGLAIINIVDTEEKFMKISKFLVYESIIIILFAFYQKYIWAKYGISAYSSIFGISKSFKGEITVNSTFISNNALGVYLDLIILLTIYFLQRKGKVIMKILYYTIIISSIFIIIFTLKRTPWVGLLIISIIFFFRGQKKLKFSIILAIIVFFIIIFSSSIYKERFDAIIHPNRSYSLLSRYNGMKTVSKIFMSNPMGTGVGQTGMTARSRIATLSNALLFKSRGFGRVIDNYFLYIGLETGYPGFLLFMITFTIMFFQILKKNKEKKNILTLNAFITIIILLLSMIVGDSYSFVTTQMLFWVLITPAVNDNFVFNNEKIRTDKIINA